MLTIHGQRRPRGHTDHLYVPIKEGGRLIYIERAYIAEGTKFMEYVDTREDPLM